jgi:hypothetical protein
MLALHPLTIEVHHAADGGLNSFRAAAREYLSTKDHFVIVNYLRRAIGQQKPSHRKLAAARRSYGDRTADATYSRFPARRSGEHQAHRFNLHRRLHFGRGRAARRASCDDTVVGGLLPLPKS